MAETPSDQEPPESKRVTGELTAPARADRLPRRGGPRGPSWAATPARPAPAARFGTAVTIMLWLLAALGVAIAVMVLRDPAP